MIDDGRFLYAAYKRKLRGERGAPFPRLPAHEVGLLTRAAETLRAERVGAGAFISAIRERWSPETCRAKFGMDGPPLEWVTAPQVIRMVLERAKEIEHAHQRTIKIRREQERDGSGR